MSKYLVRCALAEGRHASRSRTRTAPLHVFRASSASRRGGRTASATRCASAGPPACSPTSTPPASTCRSASSSGTRRWAGARSELPEPGGDVLRQHVPAEQRRPASTPITAAAPASTRTSSRGASAPSRRARRIATCSPAGSATSNGCVPSDAKTNNVADGYKACAMGEGPHTRVEPTDHGVAAEEELHRLRSGGAGKTADGRTVRYDFESGVNGWTADQHPARRVVGRTRPAAQTGSKFAQGDLRQRRGHAPHSGPDGPVAGRRHQGELLSVPRRRTSKLTQMNPFVKKQGGNEWKVINTVPSMLKGSWNIVTITVPAGAIGQPGGRRVQDQRRLQRLPRRGHLVTAALTARGRARRACRRGRAGSRPATARRGRRRRRTCRASWRGG